MCLTTGGNELKKSLLVSVALLLGLSTTSALAQETGIVSRPSKYSASETAERFEAAVKASGSYRIFFRLDHAAMAAQEAGVTLKPSVLFLFGNPKGGAPLMQSSATLGLDLPNRLLIWEDASGKVWLSYNDIRTLLARHGIKRTDEQIKTIEDRQKVLLDKAAD